MPFAGAAARAAVAALLGIARRPGDELILADNAGTAAGVDGIAVVRADGERSPAHARNAGAARAWGEWILFLDADCEPSPDLLDAYFATPPAPDVGALAGEIVPAPGARTLAARYGTSRNFLSQEAHLAHPYRPRAAAANLLVRRSAFEALGGFTEGVRAAEDTDFCWRLQAAGWRLQLCSAARVEHSYRGSIGELRRQWRGYAAGRAWLARRYEGFAPEPALVRAVRRVGIGSTAVTAGSSSVLARTSASRAAGRLARGTCLTLDALLAAEELVGLTLSNRPGRPPRPGRAEVVLVAGRFPTPGDLDFTREAGEARVEAAARPDLVAVATGPELSVDYREDDGVAARLAALVVLSARHPLRCAADLVRRRPGEPDLTALAPAARRLTRDDGARVQALGGEEAGAGARRLAALAGRCLEVLGGDREGERSGRRGNEERSGRPPNEGGR